MFPCGERADAVELGWLVARLEAGLGLGGLNEALAGTRCLGATRFYDCGEDAPDLALTCLWLPSAALVECVRGWPRLAPAEAADCSRTVRWRARVPRLLLPGPLRGWGRVRESVGRAPSCGPPGDLVS